VTAVRLNKSRPAGVRLSTVRRGVLVVNAEDGVRGGPIDPNLSGEGRSDDRTANPRGAVPNPLARSLIAREASPASLLPIVSRRLGSEILKALGARSRSPWEEDADSSNGLGVDKRVPHVMSCETACGPSCSGEGEGTAATRG
jgi:hypothetical protein